MQTVERPRLPYEPLVLLNVTSNDWADKAHGFCFHIIQIVVDVDCNYLLVSPIVSSCIVMYLFGFIVSSSTTHLV